MLLQDFNIPCLESMADLGNDSLKRISLPENLQDDIVSFRRMAKNDLYDKDGILVPRMGMTFESAEEAYQVFLAYGYRTGFGVAKRSCHSVDGVKYRATFMCFKGGKPRIKPGLKARRRLVAKTNCKVLMIVKANPAPNRWEVVFLELEHNHPCNPEMVRFMMCFKDLPDWQKDHRPFNAKTRLNPKIHAGRGRPPNQNKEYVDRSFIQRDYTIEAGRTGKLRFVEGDVESLLVFFDKMQAQNSNFFYSWDMDEEGRIKNVCWVDARSREAYQYFGDVVSFDTVYLNYQYVMPLVAFLGINHHGQFVLLGCGLLGDESTQSYIWLFKKWLKCMNDKAPDGIITSHSKAIAKAVGDAFPNARYRFSLWHIMKELPEMSGRLDDKEAINLRFKKVIYDTLTVSDFEKEWIEMIGHYHLQDNHWLSYLFEDRAKWVPAYVKDTFWAGISTVKRSERLEAFFDGYITPETTIQMFVEQFDVAMKLRFDREAYDDFRSFQQRPQLISGLLFEEQLAKIYTINMFQKFQDQVKQLMHMICIEVSRSGTLVAYTVTVFGKERKVDYRVVYNGAEQDVWCICRSFQFKGILCSHALAVLRQELMMKIPSKFILNRWRMDYKRIHAAMSSPEVPHNREMKMYDYLYKHGQKYFADIVDIGAMDVDAMEYALSVMKEAREKILKFEETRGDRRVEGSVASTVPKGNNSSIPASDNMVDGAPILAPATTATTAVKKAPARTKSMKKTTPVSAPIMTAATTTTATITPTPTAPAVAPSMFLIPMHPHPMVFPPFPAPVPLANFGGVAVDNVKKKKRRKKRKGSSDAGRSS